MGLSSDRKQKRKYLSYYKKIREAGKMPVTYAKWVGTRKDSSKSKPKPKNKIETDRTKDVKKTVKNTSGFDWEKDKPTARLGLK